MSPESLSLAPVKALINALNQATKPVAVLVGSPLSMPDRENSPGVPGISEILQLARGKVQADYQDDFDKEVSSSATPALRYQKAMCFLRNWYSQDAVNEVVRQAVRQARLSPKESSALSDEQLERDPDGWYLPAGTRDLATLVMRAQERWSGPLLTTNFDPLLSVAIKQAGGIPIQTILDADGRLHGTNVFSNHAKSIVHLHGYWIRSDTLHTPDQLTEPRPYLSGALKNLTQKHTLLVVAYGGWDDVFTNSLAQLAIDGESGIDVLWAFYETDHALIAARYDSLLKKISQARIRGRFRLYAGVNCHEIFGQLLAQKSQAAAVHLTKPSSAHDAPYVQPNGSAPGPIDSVAAPLSIGYAITSPLVAEPVPEGPTETGTAPQPQEGAIADSGNMSAAPPPSGILKALPPHTDNELVLKFLRTFNKRGFNAKRIHNLARSQPGFERLSEMADSNIASILQKLATKGQLRTFTSKRGSILYKINDCLDETKEFDRRAGELRALLATLPMIVRIAFMYVARNEWGIEQPDQQESITDAEYCGLLEVTEKWEWKGGQRIKTRLFRPAKTTQRVREVYSNLKAFANFLKNASPAFHLQYEERTHYHPASLKTFTFWEENNLLSEKQ